MELCNNTARYMIINGSMYDCTENSNEAFSFAALKSKDAVIIQEVFPCIEGMPLFYEKRYCRLKNALETLGNVDVISLDSLLEYMNMLSKINNVSSFDFGVAFVADEKEAENYFIIYQTASYKLPLATMQDGVCLELFNACRKTTKFNTFDDELSSSVERFKNTYGKPLFDVLLVNDDGEITETFKSNFFYIKDDAVYTAEDEKVICGIIRDLVLETLAESSFSVSKTRVSRNEIETADAVFITNDVYGILPVNSVGSLKFNSSNHELIKILIKKYNDKISEDIDLRK